MELVILILLCIVVLITGINLIHTFQISNDLDFLRKTIMEIKAGEKAVDRFDFMARENWSDIKNDQKN